jgi:hypothetical protein
MLPQLLLKHLKQLNPRRMSLHPQAQLQAMHHTQLHRLQLQRQQQNQPSRRPRHLVPHQLQQQPHQLQVLQEKQVQGV